VRGRAQGIAAGILVVYELIAIVWFTDPSRFWFPIANFMGFYAVAFYLPVMIILLLLGQRLTRRRRNRPLLVPLFAVLALSLVLLAIQPLTLENAVVWFAAVVLGLVNLARR
jgi:hypothetical protein